MKKRPKQVILAWVQALNDRDAQAAAELYHEDAVNLQIAIGVPIKGKQAIRQDFEHFFRSIPDTYTRIENLFEDGEWAILEWSGGGTFRKTAKSKGKKFTLVGCGFFHIIDGKIRYQRGYWDKVSWFKQIGLPIK